MCNPRNPIRGTTKQCDPTKQALFGQEESKKSPSTFMAWLVYNHLVEDGKLVFDNVEEVLASDGVTVEAISAEIDKLYGAGLD